MDIKGWPPSLSPSFVTCSLCNSLLSEPKSHPGQRGDTIVLTNLIPGLIIIDKLLRSSLHYSSMIVLFNFSCPLYLKYYMFFVSCNREKIVLLSLNKMYM